MAKSSGQVSVVIPTYNRSGVLSDAIDTVLAQTYDPIEIIVVDDGSTDGTSDVLEQYSDCIRDHQFDKNRGANAARNKGIDLATGEFIGFLDTDDRWDREKISRQVTAFRKAGSQCGLVHTAIERRDTKGNFVDRRMPPNAQNPSKRLLLGNYVGTFSCILVRKDVFEAVGVLDESLPSWQDWEFYLRVADQFQFTLVADYLTTKRDGRPDQISSNINTTLNETYPEFRTIISARSASYSRLFQRRAMAMLSREVADGALLNGHSSIARQFLFSAVVQYPLDPRLVLYFLVSLGGIRVYNTILWIRSHLRSMHGA
jgi:glycosyltransferase involved in cell wall biosynthesis